MSSTLLARCLRAQPPVLSAVLFLLLSALPAHAQLSPAHGIIRGQVIDGGTGEGVSGASVEVLDARDRIRNTAIADDQGFFVLNRVQPGPFWLRATRIGYARTKTPAWRVELGQVVTVQVRMGREAVALAPLSVTATASTATPVLSGFHERAKRRLGGTFVRRADIELQNPARVTDLLATVPGISVRAAGGMASSRLVYMNRALPGMGTAGSPCPVQIYLDGVLATRGRQDVSPDDLVPPDALEGLEIYRGLGTVPAEFLSPEARCGVIAIWTRRAGG